MEEKDIHTPNYQNLYPRLWDCLIFNHPRAFWDDSYGLPLDSHESSKIVVFGLPKSGNVWLKSLLVDYLDISPVEPLLDIDKSGVGITHRPFDGHVSERKDFIHGVCIVRDLRDVVASYYYYSKTRRFRDARPEFHYDDDVSFYFDWFLSRPVVAHKVMTHSERYASLGVPIVRYESLRRNPVHEMSRLLLRWGFEPDADKVEKAVSNNNIEKLRKEGKLLEKRISQEHFRRGEIGTYKEELSEIVINDIERRFDRVLRRWGYVK